MRSNTMVVKVQDGYLSANRAVVNRISLAKRFTQRYAKMLEKQIAGAQAIDPEQAVCLFAQDTKHFITQQSFGRWNGIDARVDCAALLMEDEANRLVKQLIQREVRKHFKREWVVVKYTQALEAL